MSAYLPTYWTVMLSCLLLQLQARSMEEIELVRVVMVTSHAAEMKGVGWIRELAGLEATKVNLLIY